MKPGRGGGVCVSCRPVVILVIWGLGLGACTPKPFDDPLAVMVDRGVAFRFRRRATDQAHRQHANQPRWVAVLNQLIWERGYPQWQRRDAIDRLVDHDEKQFQRVLAKRIVSVTDRPTRQYLLDLAVQRNWGGLTPVAVLSYAQPDRGVPDRQRPERAMIEYFNPGRTVQQAVVGVLINADGTATWGQRAAAWELLSRWLDQPSLKTRLNQMPVTDSWIADLKAAVEQLSVLPRNREELLWLEFLRAPHRRGHWQRAVSAVAQLTHDQRLGMGFRHLPVVVSAKASLLAMSRDELESELMAKGVGRVHGDGDHPANGRLRPHGFVSMAWADLATVRLLTAVLQDPSVVGDWFRRADADHRDKRSEHGGVVDAAGGRYVVRPYEPLMVRHDRVYYPPPAMIQHLYTALAHYHFHAQDHRNGRFSAPGEGDLAFADHMNLNCLVLTFLDRDRLAVRYYQRGGAVVDLGTIRRPGSAGLQ